MPTKSTEWSSFYRDTTGALVDYYSGARIGPPAPATLWLEAPARTVDPASYIEVFDDFLYQASTSASDVNTWTAVNDGVTGTPVFQTTAVGGWFNVVTAAAANDYAAYKSPSPMFQFAADKKFWLEARFKLAEATTLESTWWFGVSDTTTTGGMQAGTAGPLASYDGAIIWKTPETAMTVNFETSNAGTQSTLSAFATSITNTVQRVGFYFDGAATTSFITPYFYNGTTWTTGTAQPITLSGLDAQMYLIWGVKAGPTAAAETLQIDYIKAMQIR